MARLHKKPKGVEGRAGSSRVSAASPNPAAAVDDAGPSTSAQVCKGKGAAVKRQRTDPRKPINARLGFRGLGFRV